MIPCTCLYYTLAAEPLAFEGSTPHPPAAPRLEGSSCRQGGVQGSATTGRGVA